LGGASREGTVRGPTGEVSPGWPPNPAPYTTPILALVRPTLPGAAIIGGGRYGPPASPSPAAFPAEYDGDVFYSDYYTGYLRRIRFNGSSWSAPPAAAGQPNADDWATGLTNPTDFLEAPDGALWYVREYDDAFDPVSGI